MWLVGLSGSGKTTLGKALAKKLKDEHKCVVLLDGDEVRELYGNDLTHTLDDRRINSLRLVKLSKFLSDQELNVICCVVSLFPAHRKELRNSVNDKYKEVFIDTDMSVLRLRDPKGIYKQFDEGNIRSVAGLDIEFPRPAKADIYIENNQTENDFVQNVDRLYEVFK